LATGLEGPEEVAVTGDLLSTSLRGEEPEETVTGTELEGEGTLELELELEDEVEDDELEDELLELDEVEEETKGTSFEPKLVL
jgi:hypothetical protein